MSNTTINFNTVQGRKAKPSIQCSGNLSDAVVKALEIVDKDVNHSIYTFTVINGDCVKSFSRSGKSLF